MKEHLLLKWALLKRMVNAMKIMGKTEISKYQSNINQISNVYGFHPALYNLDERVNRSVNTTKISPNKDENRYSLIIIIYYVKVMLNVLTFLGDHQVLQEK
jgi:hypothetical protein